MPPHKESSKFDIDQALNTKGFAEFLAVHPDADTFDMDDQEAVEKRLEVFNTKEGVKKDLRELYAGQISEEMGIKLDAADFDAINTHFEQQAIESPEELLEMREKIDTFRTLPAEISQLEQQFAGMAKAVDLEAHLGVLKTDKAHLEAGQKYLGKMGYARLAFHTAALGMMSLPLLGNKIFGTEVSDEYVEEIKAEGSALTYGLEGKKAIQKKYGKKVDGAALGATMDERIASTEKALSAVQEVERLKTLAQESFIDLRKELIGGISGIEELTKAIKQKALSQLEQLTKSGSVESLNEAQVRFEELRGVAEATETGVNPLGGVDERAFQEQTDVSIEKAASEQLMETLLKAKLGANALTNFEKSLQPLLDLNKLGSKEGDESRQFLIGALEVAAANLGDDNEAKAKKLIVARILIKLNKK